MRKAFLFTSLVLSSSLFASQDFVVEDGQTIDARISSENLNRIHLLEDRIESIKALDGQFQYQHDPKLGELYLKPSTAYKDKPINLYLTSENGFSYALTLRSGSDKPQTILLKNPNTKHSDVLEQMNEQDEIQALLNQMYLGKGNNEFTRQVIDVDKLTIRDEVAVTHQANFWGHDYYGEVLLISNDSEESVTLHESDIVDSGAIAVVILAHELEPEQFTLAYRVKRHV
ncbi:MAG: type-F conjugative transfer system secretin TraK [Legionellales bacterium]|jgi:type-F conjugative transfer system secretin TraK